jgi:hypothetical protein
MIYPPVRGPQGLLLTLWHLPKCPKTPLQTNHQSKKEPTSTHHEIRLSHKFTIIGHTWGKRDRCGDPRQGSPKKTPSSPRTINRFANRTQETTQAICTNIDIRPVHYLPSKTTTSHRTEPHQNHIVPHPGKKSGLRIPYRVGFPTLCTHKTLIDEYRNRNQ